MSRGGSRYGAGRPAHHVKAEHCRKIDVRRWVREGTLRDGLAGGWAWTDAETGETLASIGYRVEAQALVLTYSINGAPMHQRVPILRTACNYGGERHWFGCPRCSRRVAMLYLRNLGFACRTCNRISYASQSDDLCGRTWRRQAKLEARLDTNWQRPKGMHHRTRKRLLVGILECEETREDALAVNLSRVMHLL